MLFLICDSVLPMGTLTGKKAFIAGIGDDRGFGWAIAKELALEGCEILCGTWVPMMKIFTLALRNNKFDTRLENGEKLTFSSIYPIDASYDSREDIPNEVLEHKRYKDMSNFTISEVAQLIEKEHGKIDFLVHSLANAPEIQKSLLETSRKGYLAALSSSSYSFVSMVKYFSPFMHKGGSIINLSYLASQKNYPWLWWWNELCKGCFRK